MKKEEEKKILDASFLGSYAKERNCIKRITLINDIFERLYGISPLEEKRPSYQPSNLQAYKAIGVSIVESNEPQQQPPPKKQRLITSLPMLKFIG